MRMIKLWMTTLSIITISQSSFAQEENASAPQIKTNKIELITHYSAMGGGKSISGGDSPVIKCGLCWSSKTELPDLSNQLITIKGNDFQAYIKCLEPQTKYFVRAFAINETDTAYGNVQSFSTLSDKDGTASDIEGNIYKTVKIGSQTWFAENLRTSRYNNGAIIPTTDKEIYEEADPHYQWPTEGSKALVENYGRLYTWHVVSDGRKLCPCGWHVPTNDEWLELIDYLGGVEEAGGKLKEAGTKNWHKPNTGADNASKFGAIPAGLRDYTSAFAWLGQSTTFWTSDENDEDDAISYTLNHLNSEAIENIYSKKAGYSVRCIKD